MATQLTAEVQTRVSKANNPYLCIVVTFPNGYEKVVFLDQAERYMVEALNQEPKFNK